MAGQLSERLEDLDDALNAQPPQLNFPVVGTDAARLDLVTLEIEIFREECGNPIMYPLVICYIAMEHVAQLQLIYLLKVVIFNSHVNLPEGIIPKITILMCSFPIAKW